MSQGKYNMNNRAVKRIFQELREMAADPSENLIATAMEDDIFEWHFTVRGPPDTEFENGVYHGRITLPPEYPFKPPSIMLLTPNGRFELCKKICLSISNHHPESWQPSWSIRTMLQALIGFFPSKPDGAIGSLDFPAEDRRALALRSHNWKCDKCGATNVELLPMTNNPNPEADQLSEKAMPPPSQPDSQKVDDPVVPAPDVSLGETNTPEAPATVTAPVAPAPNVSSTPVVPTPSETPTRAAPADPARAASSSTRAPTPVDRREERTMEAGSMTAPGGRFGPRRRVAPATNEDLPAPDAPVGGNRINAQARQNHTDPLTYVAFLLVVFIVWMLWRKISKEKLA